MLKKTLVSTPYGEGVIDNIKITELGFIRLSVHYEKEGIWKSWFLGKIEELLEKEPKLKLVESE